MTKEQMVSVDYDGKIKYLEKTAGKLISDQVNLQNLFARDITQLK